MTANKMSKCNRYYYANTPMQYTAKFHCCKNVHFQMKYFNIFLIFAQNIDCGYRLKPPQSPQSMFWRKNKKKYPCKPQVYYIKVGCKGVFVTRTCFRGVVHFCRLAYQVFAKEQTSSASLLLTTSDFIFEDE